MLSNITRLGHGRTLLVKYAAAAAAAAAGVGLHVDRSARVLPACCVRRDWKR